MKKTTQEHILKKYYSAEDKLFHIITYERVDKTYKNFNSFYNALGKDLAGSNLLEYNFQKNEVLHIDLSKARISSKVMKKFGIQKSKIYKLDNVENPTPITNRQIVSTRKEITLKEYGKNDNDLIICYLSDLHINNLLLKRFGKFTNIYEIENFCKEKIISLKNSIPKFSENINIFLIGDISFRFDFFKIFFNTYTRFIHYKTFFVIGNHELFDTTLINKYDNIDEIIEHYRRYLNSISNSIILLENQLYFPNDTKHIYNENEILNFTREQLSKLFLRNPYSIFGATGYAALNKNYNYEKGLYKGAPLTKQKEIELSNRVNELHKKLSQLVPDKKIFFITHMPKSDWSSDEIYVKNWVYLNGHTHHNFYIENDERKIYADNQIGYDTKSISFKYITTPSHFDLFQEYKDGIYEITKEEYVLFNYGTGIRIDFNRNFDKIFMIKRNNIYCFFVKSAKTNELKLLNGGSILNMENNDLQYYYDNIHIYSNAIKDFLREYSNYQKQISKEVRSFGGNGTIHGCIIDIDYYNHLFLNPFEPTIIPYYATSITDKYVYKNLASLLKYKAPNLYIDFKEKSNDKLIVLNKNLNLTVSSKNTKVENTEMYRVSNIIKSLQYNTQFNIIRLWNDKILQNTNHEAGQMIVREIVYPVNKIKSKNN